MCDMGRRVRVHVLIFDMIADVSYLLSLTLTLIISIDLDLPLETDDEYFTAEAGFRQPLHKPSQLTFFNYFVRLTQILIGALRTIVSRCPN